MKRFDFGHLWRDNLLPLGVGLLAAIIHVIEGPWYVDGNLLLHKILDPILWPVIFWCIWQLLRRLPWAWKDDER